LEHYSAGTNYFSGTTLDATPPLTSLVIKSQRDVAIDVPVNYVTKVGVSLSTACFSDGRFEEIPAAKCMSNLLATGFSRLLVDLFWDYNRREWSFCPVQIPTTAAPGDIITTSISVPSQTISIESSYSPTSDVSLVSSGLESGMTRVTTAFAAEMTALVVRQASSTVSGPVRFGTPATHTSSIVTSPTTVPGSGEEVVVSLGPYNCSTTFNLASLIAFLSDYAKKTDDTLDAKVDYITFNVHAAAAPDSPTAAAPTPPDDALPNVNQTIGSLMDAGLAASLYTLSDLRSQREDINNTWLRSNPSSGYYTEDTGQGRVSVSDGWPTGFYLLSNAQRFIVELGTVDPQMANYTAAGRDNYIFPPNSLFNNANITTTQNGTIIDGCLFVANETDLHVNNASWATTSLYPDVNAAIQATSPFYDQTLLPITNLTACGISFTLNTTLSSTTADAGIAPFRELARSSIWSWAPGQPASASTGNDSQQRCAGLSLGGAGRWTVLNCQDRHQAACRAAGRPHVWHIPSQRGTYAAVDNNCPAGYGFAVPRTALENRYLLEALREASGEAADATVWINFNSLSYPNCWVTGVSTQCPYEPPDPNIGRRRITVPAVAAVVVLVVALLTLIVKINANRQNSRRKRVGHDGWDYEGVPA